MMGTCERSRTERHSSIPVIRGMDKSVTIRSGSQSAARSSALSPSLAVLTSYPCAVSVVFRTRVICVSSSTTRIRLLSAISAQFLRNNVDINRRRVGQKTVDRGQVQIFSPAMHGRPAKDDLCDLMLTHKFRNGLSHDVSCEMNCLGPKIFRKANVRGQGSDSLLRSSLAGLNMDHVELRIEPLGQARTPRDQLLRRRIRTDANCHPLADTPVLVDVFALEIRFKTFVHRVGHVSQRQFTQRQQVAGAE